MNRIYEDYFESQRDIQSRKGFMRLGNACFISLPGSIAPLYGALLYKDAYQQNMHISPLEHGIGIISLACLATALGLGVRAIQTIRRANESK